MDEIESLFDDVTPEDLQPPTTAVRRMFGQRDLHDDEEFGRFLVTYIEATRIASEVADGYMPGLAVLATADELRVKKAFNGNAIDVINWYAQATTLDLARYGVLHPADNMRCYVGTDPAGADPGFRRILTGAA